MGSDEEPSCSLNITKVAKSMDNNNSQLYGDQ